MMRRLTVAFVLVAAIASAVLALTAYLMVRQTRFDDSLRLGELSAREALTIAQDELQGKQSDAENDAEDLDRLRETFTRIERDVLLIPPGVSTGTESESFPDPEVRAQAATGQIVFQRKDDPVSGQRLLLVGSRISGSDAELYVVRSEDRIYQELDQLRNVLLAGWIMVVVIAVLVGQVVRLTGALEGKVVALSEAHARERRFTADVAHELRTPVTALVAEASLLHEHLDHLPEPARRPAELLLGDVVRLRHLVEDLMELSRLDAGQEEVSARPVEVRALAQAVVDTRGWQERVEVAGGPLRLMTDPRRLERVLANLIANAVEHGGQDIKVDIGPVVRVTDRGPGIAPEHMPHLFDRFYKADPARAGTGSGLGLAIARENARLLGGEVHLWSMAGIGTEVSLTLPVTERLLNGEVVVDRDTDREEL